MMLLLKKKVPASSLDGLLANISKYSTKLRNNAGGHYNHESFWTWMTPGGKALSSGFTQVVETAFGSVNDMKNNFTDSG
jgi:Fe-Mn family superoxide dismutase